MDFELLFDFSLSMFIASCTEIAPNVHGLAMWWHLKIVRPVPQPNKNTKDEVNKQKPNRITSAETAADSDKMPKLTTSSHHIAKPPVVGWLLHRTYLPRLALLPDKNILNVSREVRIYKN